jgi:hypothetical protein
VVRKVTGHCSTCRSRQGAGHESPSRSWPAHRVRSPSKASTSERTSVSISSRRASSGSRSMNRSVPRAASIACIARRTGHEAARGDLDTEDAAGHLNRQVFRGDHFDRRVPLFRRGLLVDGGQLPSPIGHKTMQRMWWRVRRKLDHRAVDAEKTVRQASSPGRHGQVAPVELVRPVPDEQREPVDDQRGQPSPQQVQARHRVPGDERDVSARGHGVLPDPRRRRGWSRWSTPRADSRGSRPHEPPPGPSPSAPLAGER